MSLSDFALPSKYSDTRCRPQIHSSTFPSWREMNNLIRRIGTAKAESTYLDSFVEENKDDDWLLTCLENVELMVTNSLLQSRRPWSAPTRSLYLLEDAFPQIRSKAYVKVFETCPASNNENCPPTKMKPMIMNPLKLFEKKSAQLSMHCGSSDGATQKRSHRRPFLVEYNLANKTDLSQKRNKRIHNAKSKRRSIFQTREKNMRETINKKEQRRLRNNKLQETIRRQEQVIRAIILGAFLQRWLTNAPEILACFKREKSLELAAMKIQSVWRKDNFVRKAFEARIIKRKLKSSGWRIVLHIRCSRRRLYARVIQSFLVDLLEHPMPFLLLTYRARIFRAQKLMRDFLVCKRGRIKALEKMWSIEEREVVIAEEAKIKRRRRKNALTDITKRRILSKGMVGIVNTLSQETDGRQLSQSRWKESTPCEHSVALCQFYLEDSRRLHTVQSSSCASTSSKNPPKVTCNDAINLLSCCDFEKVVQYHPRRLRPLFILYGKKEDFRSRIESFRQNPDRGVLEIRQRMQFQKNCQNANRHVSGLLPAKKNRDKCEDRDIYTKLAQKLEISLSEVMETKVLFDLIDKDSKGYLSSMDIESVFNLMCVNSQRVHTLWSGKVEFQEFVVKLQCEMSRDIKHSSNLIIDAFDFFAKKENLHSEGLTNEKLLDILQNGQRKWSQPEAIECLQSLHGIGFNEELIHYRPLVQRITKLWTCKSLCY